MKSYLQFLFPFLLSGLTLFMFQCKSVNPPIETADTSSDPITKTEPSIDPIAKDLTDISLITAGLQLYQSYCSPCHGKYGEGNVIGQNLTDYYAIHGNRYEDIVNIMNYGVPEKGMISWKNQLSAEEIHALAIYLMTLEGSNPPGYSKEPEGRLYPPSYTYYNQQPKKATDYEQQVEESLEIAHGMQKEIILFFTADWCTECEKVFEWYQTNHHSPEWTNIDLIPLNVSIGYQYINRYNLGGVPTFIKVDSHGTELARSILPVGGSWDDETIREALSIFLN